jgi:alkaline phosphatase
MKEHGEDSEKCDDIAEQLILREPGKNINVIMGGGRREFRDDTMLDEERNATGHEVFGKRLDGKDLIQDWKSSKDESSSKYVTTLDELKEVNTETTDFLLGLFEHDHIGYYDQREEKNDPTLADMVDVAIQILSKNPKGFFLFVEGGRYIILLNFYGYLIYSFK